MHSISAIRVFSPVLFLLLAVSSLAAAVPHSGPSPELSPEAVVRSQLAALRNEDMTAGIREAYRYAAPGNRRIVGDAAAFGRMLRRQYADMLTQSNARVSLRARDGDRAQVRAELRQPDGRQSAYVFVLGRQTTGDCAGCWMTEGVIAMQPETPQPLYSI